MADERICKSIISVGPQIGNPVIETPPEPSGEDAILKEDGFNILNESGDNILIE